MSSGLAGVYPPITNPCALASFYLSHAPLRSPGSYTDLVCLAMMPSDSSSLAARMRAAGFASDCVESRSGVLYLGQRCCYKLAVAPAATGARFGHGGPARRRRRTECECTDTLAREMPT